MAEDAHKIRRRKLLLIIIIFVFFCGVGAAYYSSYKAGSKKGILRLHGWVEGTEVSLSAKVTGEIIELNVEESSEVKKGDLVALIKSDQIQSQVANAEADSA